MSSEIKKLALFGGEPAFAKTLHVNRPIIPDRDRLFRRLDAMIESRWFTNDGPMALELEQRICRYLGVRNCVLTTNGTSALELLARALDLKGEVIVPAFTFIATPNAMMWHGLEPVFCDIDPATLNIDPAHCEALISPRTSAILGVHVWGNMCDTEQLQIVADKHDVRLVFDAAHAFGCGDSRAMVGSFGDAEVFSFHATKAFHCAEGGAITTDNDELAEMLRKIRNFGFVGLDETEVLGVNAKMSELSAATGLTNLDDLEMTIEKSRRVLLEYSRCLSDVPGIEVPVADQPRHNYHYAATKFDAGVAGLSRDTLVEILHAENVFARRYFYPGCHRMQPYKDTMPETPMLPHTEMAAEQCLVLPAGPEMALPQVEIVCEIIRLAVREAGRIPAAAPVGA